MAGAVGGGKPDFEVKKNEEAFKSTQNKNIEITGKKEPVLCDQYSIEKNISKTKDSIDKGIEKIKGGSFEPIPDKIKSHFDDIFGKLSPDPAKVVENIRTSKGKDQVGSLISFQTTIDKMTKEDLKDMRDYLVKSMADPKNNDDELLGALLGAVNKEIDSRSSINSTPPFRPPYHGTDFGNMVEKYSCSFSTIKNKI